MVGGKSILRKETTQDCIFKAMECVVREKERQKKKRGSFAPHDSGPWPGMALRGDCESSCHGGEHEMSMGEEKNCSLEMQTTDHLIFLLSMATHKNGKG